MFKTPMESMAADDPEEEKGDVKPGRVRSVTVERVGKGASVRTEKEPEKGKDGASSYEPSKSDFFSDEDEAFEHARNKFAEKSFGSKAKGKEKKEEKKDEGEE